MFNPRDIIDVMAKNIVKTKNPFGIDIEKLNTWWRGEDIKDDGEFLLFTGLMYQMVPYIEFVTSKMEQIEDKKVANYTSLGKFMPSSLSSMVMERLVSKKKNGTQEEVLKNIAMLLKKSNVDFFYRPELDMYSGILLYDLGDEKYFKQHAYFVASRLQEANITKIITVDPHTTYALKVLYPKYINISFEVYTYLELIKLEGASSERVVLHDPCFYGRYLKLSDVPRNILHSIGVEIEDIQQNSTFTHCCGGPAESLSPKLADKIRKKRLSQLDNHSNRILTMCPICYANLKKETTKVQDIANFLKSAVN